MCRIHEVPVGTTPTVEETIAFFAPESCGTVRHLVLTGVATSGVVLSTLRSAADLDYRITVLSDGCGDGDPEVHRVLTEKVFPTQATVTTVDEWVAGLG